MGIPLLLFRHPQKKRAFIPTYSDRILSLNPIAYWPLNDTSGVVARNSVSTSLNGAYTGVDLAQAQAPFVAPLWGGSGDYLDIYSTALNTAYVRAESSLSIWIKPFNVGVWTDTTTRRAFLMVTTGSQDGYAVTRSTTNNRIDTQSILGGTAKGVNLTGQSFTAWTHFCLITSKASDYYKLYVNGAQAGSTQTSLGVASANNLDSNASLVGAGSKVPAQVWNGWLAHVALWGRPLTPTEIGNLYTWGLS